LSESAGPFASTPTGAVVLLSASGWISRGVLLPNGRLIYSRLEGPSTYKNGSLWEIKVDLRTGRPGSALRKIADWPDQVLALD
jgi:hypothetical protein